MLKFIMNDTVNDVAIIKTSFGYNVRYGLQVDIYRDLTEALDAARDCVSHAISEEFDD